MRLFKRKAEKELDSIIQRMAMNLANNYKDNAQDNLKELEEALEAMRSADNVKAAVIEKYESIVGIYKEKMKEFRHKDQKPYWY